MTALNMARHRNSPHMSFWRNLKDGYDLFEAEGVPPKVAACRGRYMFGADAEGDKCVAIAAWS